MTDPYSRQIRWLLRTQGPLLGLIVTMFLIFDLQALPGAEWYRSLMVVPQEVVKSWNHLRGGTVSVGDWREFGTLLSYAFLHGNMEHVSYNTKPRMAQVR